MIVLLGWLGALVVIVLCVEATLRYLHLGAIQLVMRMWAFLATLKLLLIWLPYLVPIAIFAQFMLAFLLLPELSLVKGYYVLSSPLQAPALLSVLSLVSSGIAAVVIVLGTLTVKKILGRHNFRNTALLVIFGFGLTTNRASAQSSFILPTKTIQVLPSSDVVIVAWVNASAISLPSTSGVNPTLVSDLNSSITCLDLLGEWTIGIADDITSDLDSEYADAYLVKNSGNGPPPNTINPTAYEQAGDFRLFNRMQTTYRVKSGAVLPAPKFLGSPQFAVGLTINPCVQA